MKPTKEQIEAALAYFDDVNNDQACAILQRLASDNGECPISAIGAIYALAAAYREAMAEITNLQSCLESMHAQTERDDNER